MSLFIMYYVYIIQSEKDGRYYTGMSKDINVRLREHNSGKSKYTKSYLPWKLVYSEGPFDTTHARKREKQLKRTEVKRKVLGG